MDRETLHRLLRLVEPRPWSDHEEARALQAIQGRVRRERRTILRLGSGLAAAALLALLVASTGRLRGITGPLATVPPQAASGAPDAARVELQPLDERSRLSVEDDGQGTIYRLDDGGVRIRVFGHAPGSRPLRLRVGELLIEDIGTVFEVRRLGGGKAEVRVLEGLVRVTFGLTSTLLGAGETRDFPEQHATPAAPTSVASPPALPPAPVPHARPAGAPRASPRGARRWEVLARGGDYEAAFALLSGEEKGTVRGLEDLLLAGDVARLTGHPQEAVTYLRQARAEPPGHPLAAMAAFTLGRLLLDDLSQPGPAAVELEHAFSLGGPLAEDALARAVEAHGRAGHAQRARQLAERYVATYPSGRRRRAVSLFGGLADAP
jgi:transmembrane sensor